ncbi:MAG TPA: hypothetical protein VGS22_23815 [Thermoanaerobaculia bacterium]|nr:hypothetical protein [Thermoanaerobaculia bacterium]
MALPAISSFGIHVVEHVIPLGFSRYGPRGTPEIPPWVGRLLLAAAEECVLPTWTAMGVALIAITRRSVSWPARSLLISVAGLAYVSMQGITAILHSCWGEARHLFWF